MVTKVLFFYASWCRLCKMVRPEIEEVEKQFAENVSFEYINVEDDSPLAIQYDVRSLPTVVIVQKDRAVWKRVGEVSRDALIPVIEHFAS